MSRSDRKRKWFAKHSMELTSPLVSTTSYEALGVEHSDFEELELSTAVQTQLQQECNPFEPPETPRQQLDRIGEMIKSNVDAHRSNGLPLLKALQESTFLYRAGRRYTATAMLVTDGIRFWTSDLNFNGMYTEEISLPLLQDQPVWRPLIGSESGWRLA